MVAIHSMNSASKGLSPGGNKLINTFSAYLVKDGHVSKELGRQLKRAEEMRLVADYNGESVEQADAAELVSQAEVFVSEMQRLFFEDKAAPGHSDTAGA